MITASFTFTPSILSSKVKFARNVSDFARQADSQIRQIGGSFFNHESFKESFSFSCQQLTRKNAHSPHTAPATNEPEEKTPNEMKRIGTIAIMCGILATAAPAPDQNIFSVTGTQIPPGLVRTNYGKVPNGIQAFDLNICNETTDKHSLTASQIYQALAQSSVNLQPLGRQIMLAVILKNQQHSAGTVLTISMNAAVGILSVLGASRTGIPANVLAGAAVGSAIAQQLLNNLRPVLTPDQVERYESQVLEPALVLDGGSCVERTVFALGPPGAKSQFAILRFHIR